MPTRRFPSVRSTQPFDEDVCNLLRTQRNRVGLSQDELGKELGVSFQQIQKYERGLNRISFARAAQISAILKVPLDDLAGINGKRLSKAMDTIDFEMLERLGTLEADVKPVALNIMDLINRQAKKRK